MATATALPDANSEKITTRSSDYVWMIGSPLEQLTGARLPSGRDVMCNFLYYHRLKKLPIRDSANAVYDQLMPFWSKARLPVRAKHHIVKLSVFINFYFFISMCMTYIEHHF
jgi:hypothetical protein